MPGIADKFTQSAQGRLLWPGMTILQYDHAILRPVPVPRNGEREQGLSNAARGKRS
jgi:hypothetical protein